MYEIFKKILLAILKVPPEPLDPMGEVKMLKVFRAAQGYYRYRMLQYLIGQAVLFTMGLGIAIGLFFTPKINQPLLIIGVTCGVCLLFLQSAFAYAMVRLDFEMRWYKITDRSLRIREGITHVREMTMTFANIQNLTISQGPLQKLFGISDLKVQSAGGGGTGMHSNQEQAGMFNAHTAYFRGVDNAAAIRDMMLDRLKHLKDGGLGDHEDARLKAEAAIAAHTHGEAIPVEALHILQEIRVEAQRLRLVAAKA